jgi:hypothetical protein
MLISTDLNDKLIEFCKYIDTKKSKFLLSNSNTNYIKDNLKKYKIEIVDMFQNAKKV